jgi:hypothetical protein
MQRTGQTALAKEVVQFIRGEDAARRAEFVSDVLYGTQTLNQLKVFLSFNPLFLHQFSPILFSYHRLNKLNGLFLLFPSRFLPLPNFSMCPSPNFLLIQHYVILCLKVRELFKVVVFLLIM